VTSSPRHPNAHPLRQRTRRGARATQNYVEGSNVLLKQTKPSGPAFESGQEEVDDACDAPDSVAPWGFPSWRRVRQTCTRRQPLAIAHGPPAISESYRGRPQLRVKRSTVGQSCINHKDSLRVPECNRAGRFWISASVVLVKKDGGQGSWPSAGRSSSRSGSQDKAAPVAFA